MKVGIVGYPLNAYRYKCFNTDSQIYTKITNYKYINYHKSLLPFQRLSDL